MNNSFTPENPQKTSKKIGLRKSVDNHCKSCIYDELEPYTWRKQVELCTISTCALHPFRPKPLKTNNRGLSNASR